MRTLTIALLMLAACSSSAPPRHPAGTGGSLETGGSGGDTGGAPGTGGSATGGASPTGGAPGTGGASSDAGPVAPPDAATDDAATSSPGDGPAPIPGDYGGVGKLVLVPLQHTATPVGPEVAAECPDDPTAGFTEYDDSFVVQRPRDLAASDRFSWDGGTYHFWVKSTDLPHNDGTTKPRTEARYSDMGSGEHIWTGDVMFESPSKTCIFQIHNVKSPIAIYLRIEGDRMFNLSTGKTILTGQTGKWFNLKVALNIATREVKTYVNNCLKETSSAPNTASVNLWYFKHGVYTCDTGTCRSNYKNIHLYQRGSMDKYNVMSTYP
jgi:hypothetical protein